MRIIARRTLREFWIKHPTSRQPLDNWYRIAKHAEWLTPADIKLLFRSADILPDNQVVFNISGNNYRLVVKVEYEQKYIYIRFIGTHAEYDKIDATTT